MNSNRSYAEAANQSEPEPEPEPYIRADWAAVGRQWFDASDRCVKLLHPDGRVEQMNAAGQCLMEIDDLGALLGESWDEVWPEQTRPMVQRGLSACAAGETVRFVAQCPTAKGALKTWKVAMIPIRDQVGGVRHMLVECEPLEAV